MSHRSAAGHTFQGVLACLTDPQLDTLFREFLHVSANVMID